MLVKGSTNGLGFVLDRLILGSNIGFLVKEWVQVRTGLVFREEVLKMDSGNGKNAGLGGWLRYLLGMLIGREQVDNSGFARLAPAQAGVQHQGSGSIGFLGRRLLLVLGLAVMICGICAATSFAGEQSQSPTLTVTKVVCGCASDTDSFALEITTGALNTPVSPPLVSDVTVANSPVTSAPYTIPAGDLGTTQTLIDVAQSGLITNYQASIQCTGVTPVPTGTDNGNGSSGYAISWSLQFPDAWGSNISCTVTNSAAFPHVTLTKQVQDSNGNTVSNDAGIFNLTATGNVDGVSTPELLATGGNGATGSSSPLFDVGSPLTVSESDVYVPPNESYTASVGCWDGYGNRIATTPTSPTPTSPTSWTLVNSDGSDYTLPANGYVGCVIYNTIVPITPTSSTPPTPTITIPPAGSTLGQVLHIKKLPAQCLIQGVNTKFKAGVKGNNIKSVVFYINGKRIATVKSHSKKAVKTYYLTINVAKQKVGKDTLVMKINYKSGKSSKVKRTFRVCPSATSPLFTG